MGSVTVGRDRCKAYIAKRGQPARRYHESIWVLSAETKERTWKTRGGTPQVG